MFIVLALMAVFGSLGWYRSAKLYRRFRKEFQEEIERYYKRKAGKVAYKGMFCDVSEYRLEQFKQHGAVSQLFDKPSELELEKKKKK